MILRTYPKAGRETTLVWVEHTYPAVLNRIWNDFLYWSVESIKAWRALFLAQCHHVVCSDIVDCSLRDIKLYQNFVPTGSFLLFSLLIMSGERTQKKLPMKSQRKAIVDNFCRAVTNTQYLALRYILPTGWYDIDGKRFFWKWFSQPKTLRNGSLCW